MKKLASLFAVFALLLALAAPGAAAEAQPETGRIYLYGETHATQAHLDQELAAWNDYYHQQGLRDLFIEAPSYAADFLNLWMQAEDDAILSRLYEDWEGTAMYAQETWLFYKAIKEQCPETVFHGFDVGHQYNSTGSRYLIVLMLTGQMGSADWQQTQQTIGQGRAYYQNNQDAAYRENMMAQNFARAFDALPAGSSVMAITGSLHSNLYTMDAFTGTTPCMANQLRQRYGDALVSRNLTAGVDYARAGETQTVTIGGQEYTAVCMGTQDLHAALPQFQSRTFWRVEGAAAAAAAQPATGDVLPASEYLGPVGEGEVYRIDYLFADGTLTPTYYRADGSVWQGRPATVGFAP